MTGLKNVLRSIIIAGILLTLHSNTHAQYECRSRLSGNLRPLKENSNFQLGGELILSGGAIQSSPIGNSMLFGAMEFTQETYQLYAEGGFKFWLKDDSEFNQTFSSYRFGMRALSYNYFNPKISIKAGLQQFKSSDYYLVNERAVGIDIKAKIKKASLSIATASVLKDFSRNGHFCSNAFLYDIVPARNLETGNKMLETNFLSIVYSKPIEKKKESKSSSNEFQQFDEFSSVDYVNEEDKALYLKNIGAILYSEFGTYYDNTLVLAGINTEIQILKKNKVLLQVQYQSEANNNAVQAFVKTDHEKEWDNNTATTLQLHYLDQIALSDDAMSLPRFSNLFYGEVLRMDAIDLPIGNVVLKHRWLEHHANIKLMYTHQFAKQNMQEADFSAGKLFFKKKLRVTGIGGILNSDQLESWTPVGKIEIRYFF